MAIVPCPFTSCTCEKSFPRNLTTLLTHFLGLTFKNFTFPYLSLLKGIGGWEIKIHWLDWQLFQFNHSCSLKMCHVSIKTVSVPKELQSPSLCVMASPGFFRVLLKHDYNINNILSSGSLNLISNRGKSLSYPARWYKKVLNFKWMKGIAFPNNVQLINGTCYHMVSTERNSIIFVNEKSILGIKANLHTKLRLG